MRSTGATLLLFSILLATPFASTASVDPFTQVEGTVGLTCPGPTTTEKAYCSSRDLVHPADEKVAEWTTRTVSFGEGTQDILVRAAKTDAAATKSFLLLADAGVREGDVDAVAAGAASYGDGLCLRWLGTLVCHPPLLP